MIRDFLARKYENMCKLLGIGTCPCIRGALLSASIWLNKNVFGYKIDVLWQKSAKLTPFKENLNLANVIYF